MNYFKIFSQLWNSNYQNMIILKGALWSGNWIDMGEQASTHPAVPAGRVEMWVNESWFSLDMPKSETLAIKFSSSNMLLGLTSRWITGGSYTKQNFSTFLHHLCLPNLEIWPCYLGTFWLELPSTIVIKPSNWYIMVVQLVFGWELLQIATLNPKLWLMGKV